MKILLTGMNGTVAPAVSRHFSSVGHHCLGWNRTEVPQDRHDEAAAHLDALKPTLLVHCGMTSPEATGMLARLASERDIGFVFTSTVSVFSESGTGPYTVTSVPNAEEPHGLYKRRCEEAVLVANPRAWIIRLGWQIGTGPGSNNMVDFLYKQNQSHGSIEASRRWFPSCSFLDQTASAIQFVVEQRPSGTYLANANSRLSFFEIASRLAMAHPTLSVRSADAFVRDDRMFDDRVPMDDLDGVLPSRSNA